MQAVRIRVEIPLPAFIGVLLHAARRWWRRRSILRCLRAEARVAYPEARWLPGDRCPRGLVVTDDGGGIYTLVGSCHFDDDTSLGWWLATEPHLPTPILRWPPGLRKVTR